MVNWIPVATVVPKHGPVEFHHIGSLGLVLVNTDPASKYKTALVYAAEHGDNFLAFCASELPLEDMVQRIEDADLVQDDPASTCSGVIDVSAVARGLGFGWLSPCSEVVFEDCG
jgi:uncharacterized protein (DUF952 family)